jgi:hypothetical protein
MSGTFAVLWSLQAELHTGRLEVLSDHVDLTARDGVLSIPIASVLGCSIERSANTRIRGLPVLALNLADGTVLRIASLENVTVLNDLAGALAGPHPAALAS